MSDEITRVRPARTSTEGGLGRSSPRLTTRTAPRPSDETPAERTGDASLRDRFTEIMAVKESLNLVAVSVRIADDRMEAIGTKILDLEAVVEGLRLPSAATPHAEEDRRMLTHLYGEIRRSIDALARSDDPGAQMILGRRKPDEPDQWIFPLGTRGIWGRIRRHAIHTGSPGLELPEITEERTAGELSTAAAGLETARRNLNERRRILRADAMESFGILGDRGLEVISGRKVPGKSLPGDEGEAAGAVEDVRRLLSTVPDGILHDAGPILSRSLV